MALARPRRLWSGAQFVKLCGSGTGEGFTPKPNWSVWAIFAVWPDLDRARDHIAHHPILARWRAHAAESWTVFLQPFSARGSWSGVNPLTDTVEAQALNGPIAALTRATVKPQHARAFWTRVPDISARHAYVSGPAGLIAELAPALGRARSLTTDAFSGY